MSGTEVIVEARLDAHALGHMGCCAGTLTDIRAIWRPGHESEAFVPNYETRVDALDQLKFKTGWVILGIRVRNGWRNGNQKDNGWLQTEFEFIAQPTVPDDTRLPKKGEHIQLTERLRIYITDYETRDEQRRLEPPMAHSRNLHQGDETRLWLATGVPVQLADVQVRWSGDLASVWGRIVPLPPR